MNRYLIPVVGCVEPTIHGPFKTEERQHHAARTLRSEQQDDDALFWLDIADDGTPSVGTYSHGFFENPTGNDLTKLSIDDPPPEPAGNPHTTDREPTLGPLRCFLLAESIELPNGDSVHLWEIATEPIGGVFHTTGYTFTEEDAVLYAAAPDLWNVVREFCQDLQVIGIDFDDWPDLRETYLHAQAALRKVKPSNTPQAAEEGTK